MIDTNTTVPEYTKYYSIEFHPENNRDLNPYDLKAAVAKFISDDSAAISSGGNSFTVQVNTKIQSSKIQELTLVVTTLCKVTKHRLLTRCKGIIYIHGYDIEVVEEFRTGLQEQHPSIVNVEYAFFYQTTICWNKGLHSNIPYGLTSKYYLCPW